MKRKYTLKFDLPDERDYALTLPHKEAVKHVDLRDMMPPVFDQGELGSCTANALCGLREYYDLQKGDATELSRLYLYWHERALEGTINEDSGATLRDGMRVLKKYGVCPEKDYPYIIKSFTKTPSEAAEEHAQKYRIKSYHRVRSLHELKTALQHGSPVALGVQIPESFESEEAAQTGVLPVPDSSEQILGGHALLAVGYDEDKQWVIVRNSWGEQWGDKGYCYMPYEYFTEGFVVDMWTAFAG